MRPNEGPDVPPPVPVYDIVRVSPDILVSISVPPVIVSVSVAEFAVVVPTSATIVSNEFEDPPPAAISVVDSQEEVVVL